jgi:glucosamine-6-phosphate deaminase
VPALGLTRFENMNSNPLDPTAECLRFQKLLEDAGGPDLALLGIGTNGHLAFNEPGSDFDSNTRLVDLSLDSRQAYIPLFGSFAATPAKGLTLGMKQLLSARQVVLLATGADKAGIVAQALEGAAKVDVPASALQTHPDVTVVLDKQAAAKLRHAS